MCGSSIMAPSWSLSQGKSQGAGAEVQTVPHRGAAAALAGVQQDGARGRLVLDPGPARLQFFGGDANAGRTPTSRTAAAESVVIRPASAKKAVTPDQYKISVPQRKFQCSAWRSSQSPHANIPAPLRTWITA